MATKAKIRQYEADYGRRPYFKSLLLAFDQFLNAFLGGYVDETLSSRAYRCRDKRRWCVAMHLINGLFFWDKQGNIRHCQMAYMAEALGEHLPDQLRHKN